MAVVSSSCTGELTMAVIEPVEEPVGAAAVPATMPGELIVRFSEDFLSSAGWGPEDSVSLAKTRSHIGADILADLGVASLTRLYPDAGEWEERHRAAGLHQWYRVRYEPSCPETRASESFSSLDFVEYVEPVRRLKSAAVFDDPGLSRQWHYNNQGGGRYVSGADINVVPVWENLTTGSSNVIVAVVDGGIQMDHPDLNGVVIPGGTSGSRNFVDGYTGYSISATTHGTHVAGTIAAINGNGIDGCGIAGGKDGSGGVRLLSCQIFSDRTDTDGNALQGDSYNAMVWGADHGAVISQNSWGYEYGSATEAKNGGVGAMKAAIDYFIMYAGCDKDGNQLPDSPMKGGVVIFAAGNDNWPDGWPAEYEPVIAVGAMNATMSKSSYSNYGDWVDICAPGGDSGIDPMIFSTLPGGAFGALQGTSMACPHVSGVAALLVSYFGGQGFTNEMLKARLLGGANGGTALRGQHIGPLLDAYGSFMMGGTTPPAGVDDYSVSSSSNSISFSWKVTEDTDAETGRAYAYLLLASEREEDFRDLDPNTLPTTMLSATVEVGSTGLGESIEGVISALNFETDYYVAIAGYDFSKNFSTLSEVKAVRTGANSAPVIESSMSGSAEIHAFETLSIDFSIYDPDGHGLTISYENGSPADSWRVMEDGGYRLSIVGKNAPAGTYTAIVSATDAVGEASLTTRYIVTYTILPNGSPEIIKALENKVFTELGMSCRIDMDEYVSDPDGERLTYEISHSNPQTAHLNPVGNILTLTTLNYGTDEITVKASDCLGEYAETSFKICVRSSPDAVDVYPTTVSDVLHITTVTESDIAVDIVSSTGKTVLSVSGKVTLFAPLDIDMTSLGRGLYTVIVTSEEGKTKRTVFKS